MDKQVQKGGETILIRAVEDKNWKSTSESKYKANGNSKNGAVYKSLKRYISRHKLSSLLMKKKS